MEVAAQSELRNDSVAIAAWLHVHERASVQGAASILDLLESSSAEPADETAPPGVLRSKHEGEPPLTDETPADPAVPFPQPAVPFPQASGARLI